MIRKQLLVEKVFTKCTVEGNIKQVIRIIIWLSQISRANNDRVKCGLTFTIQIKPLKWYWQLQSWSSQRLRMGSEMILIWSSRSSLVLIKYRGHGNSSSFSSSSASLYLGILVSEIQNSVKQQHFNYRYFDEQTDPKLVNRVYNSSLWCNFNHQLEFILNWKYKLLNYKISVTCKYPDWLTEQHTCQCQTA